VYSFLGNISAASAGTGATTGAAGSTVVSADLIVLPCAQDKDTFPGSYSDSLGNSYSSGNVYTGAANNAHFLYCQNPAVSSGMTFSSTGHTTGVAAAWFSGSAVSPLDQQNGNINISPGGGSGSITPTQDNELVLFMVGGATRNTISLTSSPGAIVDSFGEVDGNTWGLAWAYVIQTTAAVISSTWSWSDPGYGTQSAIISFKAAIVAAASPIPPIPPTPILTRLQWKELASGKGFGPFVGAGPSAPIPPPPAPPALIPGVQLQPLMPGLQRREFATGGHGVGPFVGAGPVNPIPPPPGPPPLIPGVQLTPILFGIQRKGALNGHGIAPLVARIPTGPRADTVSIFGAIVTGLFGPAGSIFKGAVLRSALKAKLSSSGSRSGTAKPSGRANTATRAKASRSGVTTVLGRLASALRAKASGSYAAHLPSRTIIAVRAKASRVGSTNLLARLRIAVRATANTLRRASLTGRESHADRAKGATSGKAGLFARTLFAASGTISRSSAIALKALARIAVRGRASAIARTSIKAQSESALSGRARVSATVSLGGREIIRIAGRAFVSPYARLTGRSNYRIQTRANFVRLVPLRGNMMTLTFARAPVKARAGLTGRIWSALRTLANLGRKNQFQFDPCYAAIAEVRDYQAVAEVTSYTATAEVKSYNADAGPC
jgi:hypothetical protein